MKVAIGQPVYTKFHGSLPTFANLHLCAVGDMFL